MKYAQIIFWTGILILLAVLTTTIFKPHKEFEINMNDAHEENGEDTEVSEIKHSIPFEEILSGGPGKDGIPSIDDPQFETSKTTDQAPDTVGIGIEIDGDARFYGYNILVWHEIVNDNVGGTLAAVTYCPLCGTGIAFNRDVGGEVYEFGVSGKLWQSNLLMYNRTGDDATESLWSQILGEGVVGPLTGSKLVQLPADTTRLSDWLEKYPDSKILSTDTGLNRNYGRDPYGDYYTDESIMFATKFSDDRLHPKELVQGIELDGQFKAYKDTDITKEIITDNFNGSEIKIVRNTAGQIEITADEIRIEPIRSFWFSWIAVHPETELLTTK
jgi:hypothetical protein